MSGERIRNEVQLTMKQVDAATSLYVAEYTVNLKSDAETMNDLTARAKVMYDDISGRKRIS